MKHYNKLTIVCALLALTSCGTQKPIVNPNTPAPAAEDTSMAYKRQVQANRQTLPAMTARLGVNLQYGVKNVSCNGHLRMKRGDVIQLSLTLPLIGTEVGRLECTPAEVLIVDRINKQYVRATYGQVQFLDQAGLDFYALQALLWNELFVPGSSEVASHLGRFRSSASGSYTLLALTDAPRLEYDFLTQTSSARIERVNVRSKSAAEKGELVCKYADFAMVSGKPFPATVSLQIKDLGKDFGLNLSLSRINNSTDWEARTTLSAKYRQRTPEEILGQLVNIAG